MSAKTLISGKCFAVIALMLLAAAPALAQRGGRGGGEGRGDGGRGGGEARMGGATGAGQSARQSTAPQHPAPAAEGRTSTSSEQAKSFEGRPYQNDRSWGDWRGRGGGDDGRFYGRDWRGPVWWGGWGPGWDWGWGGYGYQPGYYDYGGYGPDYYDQQREEPYAYGDTSDQEEEGYYSQAVRAFEQGDYKTALRLAGHAEVDEPRDPNIHLLATLAMFALADYRGAAMQVHAFANVREIPTWDSIYELYGDVAPYTRQLRALERHVKTHQSQPDGHLVLGFLYMAGGYRDSAVKELQTAQKLLPRDRFAAQLLRKAGGTVPGMGAEREQKGARAGEQQQPAAELSARPKTTE